MWCDKIRLFFPLHFGYLQDLNVFLLLFRFISFHCFVHSYGDFIWLCVFVCLFHSLLLYRTISSPVFQVERKKRTNHFRFEIVFDQVHFKSHWNPITPPTLLLLLLLLLKCYTIWERKQKSPIVISFKCQSILFKLNYPFLVFTQHIAALNR